MSDTLTVYGLIGLVVTQAFGFGTLFLRGKKNGNGRDPLLLPLNNIMSTLAEIRKQLDELTTVQSSTRDSVRDLLAWHKRNKED